MQGNLTVQRKPELLRTPVTVGTGLVTSAQEKTAIRELLLMSRSTFTVWLDCRQPQVINVWLDPVVAGANLE